jgi:hypothetical protein
MEGNGRKIEAGMLCFAANIGNVVVLVTNVMLNEKQNGNST